MQRDVVRLAEGGTTAWAVLGDEAPSQGRSHCLAGLVQHGPIALDAHLRQPGAFRTELVCGSGQARSLRGRASPTCRWRP